MASLGTRPRFAVGLAACLVLGTSAAAPIEERAVARLRVVPVRIVPVEPGHAETCAGLEARDLLVRLRGRRVDSDRVELDRVRPPAIHAILLDTSQTMRGNLGAATRAVADYVRQVRGPDDLLLLATFDDDALLAHPPGRDPRPFLDALDAAHIGGGTALLDALVFVLEELDAQPARKLVVLLSDGIDTASRESPDRVRELLAERPDVTVFSVGFGLPPLASFGPTGAIAGRKRLQGMAERTNGRYLVVPTAAGLAAAYDRIVELLRSEAVLTIVDPDPDAPEGRVSVRSHDPACRVEPLRERPEPAREPRPRPTDPALPQSFGDEGDVVHVAHGRVWGSRGAKIGDVGRLYDPLSPTRTRIGLHSLVVRRDWGIGLPEPDALPDRPGAAFRSLAEAALDLGDAIETDPWVVPRDRHARPFHDHPELHHGTTLFELRSRLARAMFLQDDYRRWALDRLAARSEQELTRLKARWRARLPGVPEPQLDLAVRESEDGRRILERAAAPEARELTGVLSAWLGDVPAAELFRAWEGQAIDGLVAGGIEAAERERFLRSWDALRSRLWVPSYARTVTWLRPFRDAAHERIGFYRIVLPRPAWMSPRIKGWSGNHELADPPMDLVPDRPLGFLAVERMLAAEKRDGEKPVPAGAAVRYELRGPARHRDPARAFRDVRVRVTWPGPLELIADSVESDGGPSFRGLRLRTPAGSRDLVSRVRDPLPISPSHWRRWQGGPTTEYREYSEAAQRSQRRRGPVRLATDL